MSTSFETGRSIRSQNMIPPQAWDGDAALTSDALDIQGAEGASVQVHAGTVAAGADIEIAFHEGDASNFTPGSGNLIAEGNILNSSEMDATDNVTYIHSIRPTKRYVKVVVTREGEDAAAIAVQGMLGLLSNYPT